MIFGRSQGNDRFHQMRGDRFAQMAAVQPGATRFGEPSSVSMDDLRSEQATKMVDDLLRARGAPITPENRQAALQYMMGGELQGLSMQGSAEDDIAMQAMMESDGGGRPPPSNDVGGPATDVRPMPRPEGAPGSAPSGAPEAMPASDDGDDGMTSGPGMSDMLAPAIVGGAAAAAAGGYAARRGRQPGTGVPTTRNPGIDGEIVYEVPTVRSGGGAPAVMPTPGDDPSVVGVNPPRTDNALPPGSNNALPAPSVRTESGNINMMAQPLPENAPIDTDEVMNPGGEFSSISQKLQQNGFNEISAPPAVPPNADPNGFVQDGNAFIKAPNGRWYAKQLSPNEMLTANQSLRSTLRAIR